MVTATESIEQQASQSGTRPEPTLHPTNPGTLQRARDLIWLCRLIYGAAPGQGLVWAITAILQGLTAPFGIWAGSKLLDSVSAHLGGEPATSPWLWLSIAAIAIAGSRMIDIVRFYAESVVRENSGPAIQALIYRQATAIDLGLLENQGFYDSTSRVMTEVETRAPQIAIRVQDMLGSVPTMVGMLYLLVTVDWRFALVGVVAMLPNIVVFFRAGEAAWGALSDQTRDRRLASYIASQIADRQAAKEIRLFGLQEWLLQRWSGHFLAARNELRIERLRIQLKSRAWFFVSILFSLGGFSWLTLGGTETLSPGEVTILMTSFLGLPGAMFGVALYVSQLGESSGLASDVRAFATLPTPHATRGCPSPAPDRLIPKSSQPVQRGALKITNLNFTYPGTGACVIDDVTLSVEAGDRIAIVGQNGAGKTTFLKLVLGLYTPNSGTIALDGGDVHSMPAEERQRRFAVVFQHFTRYPLTIAENITMQIDARDGRIDDFDRVLELSGMKEFVERQDAGMDTLLAPDLGGTDLSGGQWQRLAIARAGWRNAAVLALDEPTAALDPMAEVGIFERFAELAHGRTTLLVSHRLGMARLADRIIVIEHGRVIEDGSHSELLIANGRYAEMWAMQSRWYQ